MGYASALAMRDALELDEALAWHLKFNHYPSVPDIMHAVCLDAIEALQDDEPDRLVTLPEGVTYRDGRSSVEAWRVVESFHLSAFVEG